MTHTGSKFMSCATPGMPIMEMAWSMPPDWVPTYRSQVHANSATSCAPASLLSRMQCV